MDERALSEDFADLEFQQLTTCFNHRDNSSYWEYPI
jgi:hypothetical protein